MDEAPPPAGGAGELDFISKVLQGDLRETQGAASTSRRRPQQQKPKPPDRKKSPPINKSKDDGDDGPPSTSTPSPLNAPSARSTQRLLHCDVCDAWVPHRPGDWEVHVAGIKHRRYSLSLREHGQRDTLVLSKFEPDPRPSGLSSASGRKAKPSSSSAASSPFFTKVRTAILVEVLSVWGRGLVYDTAGKTFAKDKQLDARKKILNTASRFRASQLLPLNAPVALAAAAAMLEEVSAAGEMLLEQITCNYACPSPPSFAETAAWLAALQVFLSRLAAHASSSTVKRLHLTIPTFATHAQPQSLALRAVAGVVQAAEALVERNTGLQVLSIQVAYDDNHPEIGHLAMEGMQERLSGAAAATARQVHWALSLSQHPRLGRCSTLQLLPTHVFANIVELAAPKGGCKVVCTSAGWRV